jgi:hypothetical protein
VTGPESVANGAGIPARLFLLSLGLPKSTQLDQTGTATAEPQAASTSTNAVTEPDAAGQVDVETQAAQDAALVEQAYQEGGPEAAALKLEELAAAHKDDPAYVDALIVASQPTIQKIAVDLGARVTNGVDDTDENGNVTRDTLTALAHVANMAGEQGQSILGSALAGALPTGDHVNLNQFDDTFKDLGEEGAALGGAVVMALQHAGNENAAHDLGEDVAKNDDGTFKTEASGNSVSGSYDHQWGQVQSDGVTDPKATDGQGSTSTELASGEVSAEAGADSGIGAETSGEVGGVEYSAEVSGPSIRLGASASGSVSEDGLKLSVEVNVDATLAQAGADGTVTVPVRLPGGEVIEVTVQLSADAMAGAYGTLVIDISLGPDGQPKVEVHGKGFAGLTGTLSGTVTVTHEGEELMSGTLSVSGAIGVGGGFDFTAGVNDEGNVEFGVEAQLDAGVGGGVNVSGEVDTKATAGAIAEILAGLVRAGFEEGAEVVIDTGETIWNTTEAAGEAIWDGTQWVGRKAKEGVEKVIEEGKDLLDKVF